MRPIYKHLAVTVGLSVGLGLVATGLVVKSENGYIAGFVYFPLFLLITLFTLVLIIAGIVATALGKNLGPWLLLAALLLPASFLGSALIAKHFEIGAYREDPMVPMIPETANIALFTKDATRDQIENFWDETLSTKRQDGRGHDHLPGLRGITRLSARDGYEVVEFDFFDSATNEQREYVFSQVRSSPIIFKLLENVPTKNYLPTSDLPPTDNRPKKEMKIERLTSTGKAQLIP